MITMFKRCLALLLVVTMVFPTAPAWAAGECTLSERVCIEGPETRTISGHPVTRDCWKYESKFNCVSDDYIDECAPIVAKGCGQTNSTCIEYLDSDPTRCSLYEQTYECKVADGATREVLDCGGQTYCVDGKCFDAGYTPDGDFAMAISGMETLRQMGNYLDPNTLTVFNGTNSKCNIDFGIFNCCKRNNAGSNQTNADFLTTAGVSAVKSVGAETISYLGSRYVYDSLFQSDAPNFIVNSFASLVGDGGSVADMTFTPGIEYFGLSVSYGGAAAGATWSAQIGSSSFYVGFDPTSFAISLAIYIIMELVSCEEQEQVLGMKRGQDLCEKVGSYCSKKALGVCYQKRESYCCFNSRLARLIAVGGRAQLGKSFGSPKSPDCGGLRPDELQLVDFSLIDFTSVLADVKIPTKTPAYAQDRADTMIKSYYAP